MTIITHKGKVRNGAVTPMFISKWDTTSLNVGYGVSGSPNDTIRLPLPNDGDYDFFVDWGDGNRDNITAYDQSEVTHQYSSTGIYEVKIYGGITGWFFNDGRWSINLDDDKIIEISNWGPLRFISNTSSSTDSNIFYGCSNLEVTAIDSLTLDGAENGYAMFRSCVNLGDQGNMNSWDTSAVTTMQAMFEDATGFNQPIGDWDTSNVTTMYGMFFKYNGGMTFNQDIGNWDVSNVTTMNQMFGAYINNHGPFPTFNNGGSSSISGWDTSSVTNMNRMFYNCTGFNQPIGNWDTSKVTDMFYMLRGANSFNQDLGGWDMTGLTTLEAFFYYTTGFNNGGSTGINNWRPSSCTTMKQMFHGATGFNQPIGDWDTSNVTRMDSMFYVYHGGMTFNQDIGNWDVSNVTTMNQMFGSHTTLQGLQPFNNGGSSSISGWDTSSVTNMTRTFSNCTAFNQPIGSWDTSSVTTMYQMLYNCDAFDQDLSDWNVASLTSAYNFMNSANGLSTANYDRTLSGWSSQSVNNGVSIHFGGSQYSTATGLAYRNALVASGWTITDGGAV